MNLPTSSGAFALERVDGPEQRLIEGVAGECHGESVHGAALPADPFIGDFRLDLSG
jgi:hypothetical protein